jgi:hypothetical protein
VRASTSSTKNVVKDSSNDSHLVLAIIVKLEGAHVGGTETVANAAGTRPSTAAAAAAAAAATNTAATASAVQLFERHVP